MKSLNNEGHKIYDEDGDSIAVVFDEANAAFIVKAVNNHRDLVFMLKRLIRQMELDIELNGSTNWPDTILIDTKKAIEAAEDNHE
jgi:hypothetical protein